MKLYKKSLLFIICLLLVIGASLSVYAIEEDHTSLADYLKEMELFSGTNTGYNLKASTTRAEAAVMVVRLLGKKDEALSQNFTHPFSDVPDWASPYVGYLYQMGIAKGVDETTYGAMDLLNGAQYMTLLLRVLSYDDASGDFNWQESIKKANELNILSEVDYNYYSRRTTFSRDDLVLFTYEALTGDIKDGKGISLLRKLMDEKIVPQSALLEYTYAPYTSGSNYSKPKSIQEFQEAILQGIVSYKESITIDLSNIEGMELTKLTDMINIATDRLIELPAYASIFSGWRYTTYDNEMTLMFEYMITKSEFDQAVAKADEVAKKLLVSGLSDYERELLIHDYIVDNCEYYPGPQSAFPDDSFTMYGLFINKQAVCQAYADAFFYLSTYAGLECQLVYGEGNSPSGPQLHAWNVIELDGESYCVDTTWDDPVDAEGGSSKVYYYFNITSDELAVDHTWSQKDYPISYGTKYNYFVYNNSFALGEEGLVSALKAGFSSKKTELSIKVKDFIPTQNQLNAILGSMSGYFYGCSYSVYKDANVVQISNIQY